MTNHQTVSLDEFDSFDADGDIEADDLFGLSEVDSEWARDGFISPLGEEYENYIEVERYWAYQPYSLISILQNPQNGDMMYYVTEPVFSEGEQALYDEINSRLRESLKHQSFKSTDEHGDELPYKEKQKHKMEVLTTHTSNIALENKLVKDAVTLEKILYQVRRDYPRFERIDPIMNDPSVEDISCDGAGVPIYVNHSRHDDLQTNIRFSKHDLNQFVSSLAQDSGEHISVANPQVDASLPDGSRINMSLSNEISLRGSTFTIRQFNDIPFTPVDLIQYETFDAEIMAYLWLAIENNKSLIFAGGTASGKTTSMNAISLFIPPKRKIVSIEDTPEITLPHDHWAPMITRASSGEGNDIDMYKLLKGALRMRPEYILVGEVRGEEAQTLFQAMSTGHTTYSTMHADSVERAIDRLENDPINVPTSILGALDIVSIQARLHQDGDAVRRMMNMSEVTGASEENGVSYNKIYEYNADFDMFTEGGTSNILEGFTDEKDWDMQYVTEEKERRERLLEHMAEEDFTNYEDVTKIIQMYMIDKDMVMEQLENGELKPEEFGSIQGVNFER